MNNPNIEESIKEIVIDVLDIDDLNSFEFNEFSKIDDFAEWDSLAHINIITQLESMFKIRFSLDEVESFAEIKDIIKSISSKI
jgi:acyl carrier protein